MKSLGMLLIVILICMGFVKAAFAEDTSQSYSMELLTEGSSQIKVDQGDSFDIDLILTRTDSAGAYLMYALSAVVRINTQQLRIDGYDTYEGIDCSPEEQGGSLSGWADVTLGYLASDIDGDTWPNSVKAATLHVTALEAGDSQVALRSASVSTYNGMDSFSVTRKDMQVGITETASTAQPQSEESSENAGLILDKMSDDEGNIYYTDQDGNAYKIDKDGNLITEDADGESVILGKADEIAVINTNGKINAPDGSPDSENTQAKEKPTFPFYIIIIICTVAAAAVIVIAAAVKKKNKSKMQ